MGVMNISYLPGTEPGKAWHGCSCSPWILSPSFPNFLEFAGLLWSVKCKKKKVFKCLNSSLQWALNQGKQPLCPRIRVPGIRLGTFIPGMELLKPDPWKNHGKPAWEALPGADVCKDTAPPSLWGSSQKLIGSSDCWGVEMHHFHPMDPGTGLNFTL